MQSSLNSARLQLDSTNRRELLLQAYRGALALSLFGLALCLVLFDAPAQITLGVAITIGIIGERLTAAGHYVGPSRLLILLMTAAIFMLAWTGDGLSDAALFLCGPLMVLAVLFLPLREYVICTALVALLMIALGAASLLNPSHFLHHPTELAQVGPIVVIFLIAHLANAFMLNNIVCRVGRYLSSERTRMAEENAVWHQAAVTDVLTRVLNRRGFMDSAERQYLRAQEDRAPLTLLMIDIDHFKAVNDTYGHAIGDLVIQNLADQLRVHFRSSDIAGRLGGEEFCVLLTGIDYERAQFNAERFRSAVAAQTVETKAGSIEYTVSIGLAWMKHNHSLPWLMQIADKALYRAKQHGRNCVMTGNYWDKLTAGKL